MKSAEILYQLQELRQTWRKQSFVFSVEQQKTYDRLSQLRRDRVKEMYDKNMVYKTGASK
jgi:hypothetical protein